MSHPCTASRPVCLGWHRHCDSHLPFEWVHCQNEKQAPGIIHVVQWSQIDDISMIIFVLVQCRPRNFMSTDHLKPEHEDSLCSSVHKKHRILLRCKTEMSLFALTETSKELKLAHIGFFLVL